MSVSWGIIWVVLLVHVLWSIYNLIIFFSCMKAMTFYLKYCSYSNKLLLPTWSNLIHESKAWGKYSFYLFICYLLIDTFIQQELIKISKVTVMIFRMLHKISFSNNCCSSNIPSSNNPEKNSILSTLYFLSSTTIYNIDTNNTCFLQISILEWFLKDHVTLKTGVMIAENTPSTSQE